MSLKHQLKELEQQRDAELKNLHCTYLRTRRDVKRNLSPDRFIRKHLGAGLGAAALAGFLLAPKPARPSQKEMAKAAEAEARKKGVAAPHESLLTHFRQLLANVLSKAEHVTAPKSAKPTAQFEYVEGKQPKFRAQSLLASLLGILMSRMDLSRVATELTKHFMSRAKPSHNGNGHHPDLSVANVGTVKPDQMNDFE